MSAKLAILDMGMGWSRSEDGYMMRGRDGLGNSSVSISFLTLLY